MTMLAKVFKNGRKVRLLDFLKNAEWIVMKFILRK